MILSSARARLSMSNACARLAFPKVFFRQRSLPAKHITSNNKLRLHFQTLSLLSEISNRQYALAAEVRDTTLDLLVQGAEVQSMRPAWPQNSGMTKSASEY